MTLCSTDMRVRHDVGVLHALLLHMHERPRRLAVHDVACGHEALPEFDWYQVFNMAGYVLPPKPPSKAEARAARNAAWVAEQEAAKKQRMEGASSTSSCSK